MQIRQTIFSELKKFEAKNTFQAYLFKNPPEKFKYKLHSTSFYFQSPLTKQYVYFLSEVND